MLRRLVAIDIQNTLEYRGEFVVYMVGIAASSVVSLLVWLAVSDAGAGLPLDRSELVTYYVLLALVSLVTSSWLSVWLAQTIRLGQLSSWLLRPAPYALSQVANNIGEKAVKALILLPITGLIGYWFREDLRLPSDPLLWLVFLVVLPMTAGVAFLIDYLIGSLAFWVEDVAALSRVRTLVATFLSGQVVPLALFPEWARTFLDLQPFRYTLSFPLEVLTGSLSPPRLAVGVALQAGYCAGLCLVCRAVWRRGLRSYSAVGA